MNLGKLANSLNFKNINIVVYSYPFKVNWGSKKLVNSTILNKKDKFSCRKQ